jgi:TIR domain
MPEQPLPSGAVFLSYASEDADAAARICEALRAAGVEVWFDRSELRGGDAWDAQIKKQIHEYALFVVGAPILGVRFAPSPATVYVRYRTVRRRSTAVKRLDLLNTLVVKT